jgi:predicted nucleotidyltransferase
MSDVDWTRVADTLTPDPNVLAAWAFGSARDGDVRRGGDIDVAVLFPIAPSLDECADLRADLQQALAFEEIDLVVLNAASALLRFEALSGRRIVCRDEGGCAAFASLAAREYEDEMAFAERGLRLRT